MWAVHSPPKSLPRAKAQSEWDDQVYYGAQLSSSLQLAFWSNANVQAEDSGHPEAGARGAENRGLLLSKKMSNPSWARFKLLQLCFRCYNAHVQQANDPPHKCPLCAPFRLFFPPPVSLQGAGG